MYMATIVLLRETVYMATMVLLRETVCVQDQNGFTEGDSVCMCVLSLLLLLLCFWQQSILHFVLEFQYNVHGLGAVSGIETFCLGIFWHAWTFS